MKDLIIQALNEFNNSLVVPETKKEIKSVSIFDVKPIELLNFMKENNIPDSAEFSGSDNGYDAYDDFCLSWEIEVPTTDKDKENYRKQRFHASAFRSVARLLVVNGYKRVPCKGKYDYSKLGTGVLSEYDMFINGDFAELVNYYSDCFEKKD